MMGYGLLLLVALGPLSGVVVVYRAALSVRRKWHPPLCGGVRIPVKSLGPDMDMALMDFLSQPR